MYFKITRKFRFHAAHRNRELVGTKCASLHGHTYEVEVDVLGAQGENGLPSVSIPFELIDQKYESLVEQMDHALLLADDDPLRDILADMPDMRTYVLDGETSAENIAVHFFNVGTERNLLVSEVRVMETPSSVVSYSGSRFVEE